MENQFNAELIDRLMRYAAIDSQSNEDSTSSPSTNVQFDILNKLEEELSEIGAEDVVITDYGVVLATIPGNKKGPTIEF